MQCQTECKNCAVLEIEKHRYKNLWLGGKHKLRRSRAELNRSKLDETTEQGNYVRLIERRDLKKSCHNVMNKKLSSTSVNRGKFV